MTAENKGFKAFIIIFLSFGLMVATHEGEFWPFSIYPMFSQAGKEWTRSMVRDVTDIEGTEFGIVFTLADLPGKSFPINSVGINQNDVSNFIEKNQNWDKLKKEGFRKLFSAELSEKSLLVYKVQGVLSGGGADSVVIRYQPFIRLDRDTVIILSQ